MDQSTRLLEIEMVNAFMGLKLCDCASCKRTGEKNYKVGPLHYHVKALDEFKYDSSWEALMPVAEKCYAEANCLDESFGFACQSNNIQKAYEIVLNQVKWHIKTFGKPKSNL